MITLLRRIISVLIALIMSFFVVGAPEEPHTVLDEKNCLLNVCVISDVHVEGNNTSRYKVFRRILKDAGNNSFGNDAAVFLGDNTMNGQGIESILFYGAVKSSHISDEYVVCCGNHDVGNGNGNYNKLLNRFLSYSSILTGVKTDKPFYYKVINGYYFIVLGPEDLCVYEMPISEEQYKFLEDTMALAAASGKPIFVLAHHPIYDIDDDEGERISGIIGRYNNVFYVYGHTHMPFIDGWSFGTEDGINTMNFPRCTELAGEKDNEIYAGTGDAGQIEVYEDEVVVRARNFYSGEWHDDMEYHFDLK